MILSFLIGILSAALFLFYLQSVCEKVLQREFSEPYFERVLKAMHLEYPCLLAAYSPGNSVDYSSTQLALKCDFKALSYLLKNGGHPYRFLPRQERLLLLYFHFLLLCLPIRHSLKFREREAVLKLAALLQLFANLIGERLTVTDFGSLLTETQP